MPSHRDLMILDCSECEPCSYAELSQVVVDVFVHENGPLLWFERTEERMWVLGAAGCAPGDEAIDGPDKLGAFEFQVALCGVRREELGRGR